MGWVSGIAVYACIWWVVIFAVLPWGVRHAGADDPEAGQGFDPGAPKNPNLLMKVLATTVVSGIVWLGVWALVRSDWISFR